MNKIPFSFKAIVILSAFLLLYSILFCQKKAASLANTYKSSVTANDTKRLAGLTALIDETANSDLHKSNIVVYVQTYRNELIQLEKARFSTGFPNTYKLLKDSAGKLLAFRHIPFIDSDSQYYDITHYFDTSGRTFSITVHQHYYYFDTTENVLAYWESTIFYDSNFNKIGKKEKLTDRDNKPLKKETNFEFYKTPYFYPDQNACLSTIECLQGFSFDSSFPKHEYFYLTGSRPEDFNNTCNTQLTTNKIQTEVSQYDTLIWFTDISHAIEYTKQEAKYIVIYFEPADCEDCIYTIKKELEQLNNPNFFFNRTFLNENYILVIAREKDSAILKQLPVKEFTGAAIFTGNKQLLYYNYEIALDNLSTTLPSLINQDLLEFLRLHYFTTYTPEAIENSGFNIQLVKLYLNTYLNEASTVKQLHYEQNREKQSINKYNSAVRYRKEIGEIPVYMDTTDIAIDSTDGQLSVIENDEKDSILSEDTLDVAEIMQPDFTESAFNFKTDTTFILEVLDSLVAKTDKYDISTIVLIMSSLGLLDTHFCPFYVSKFLSGNDTLFTPTLAYSYLLKNVPTFNYSKLYNIQLYEMVSKRLNNFIKYNQSNNYTAVHNALLLQQQFISAIPELKHLETPLLIANMLQYADIIDIDTLLNAVAIPYLDALLTSMPSMDAFILIIVKDLVKKFSEEIGYTVAYNSHLSDYSSDNNFVDAFPLYLKETFSFLFDNVAWHCYSKKEDTISLNRALRYSKASTSLVPLDPYPLNTYAHLLYKTGDRQAAISYQTKAIIVVQDSNSYGLKFRNYLTNEEKVTLFKDELEKMKEGKLY